MISQQQINEVIARTDLVGLMGNRVELKPAGTSRLKGCCPFHQEKTPSFMVYTDKQDYHCFGCGAHGNAINWVMHNDGLNYVQALRQLAQTAGINLTEETQEEQEDIDTAAELLEQSATWFQENLLHHQQAPQARDYLESRGISAPMQQLFRLGYAPPGWDNLRDHIEEEQVELAHSLGLLKRKDQDNAPSDGSNKSQREGYDAFRDRLIFPILDREGKVVGFGGRSLHQDQIPKYLNSSGSDVFVKGRLLYGEYQAKQAGRINQWLVVEGYMDVITMHQYGFTNSVACLGTSLTSAQLANLVRWVGEVCFIFDGDNAGRKAAIRAMQLCRGLITPNTNFSFLLLPEGEDPDSMLKNKGAAALQERLERASQRWSDFFLHWLFAQADSHSIEGKTKLVSLAERELEAIPNRDFRTLLLRRIKDTIGLGYRRRGARSGVLPPIKPTRVNEQERQQTGLLKLLAICIHSPDAWSKLQQRLLPQLQNFSPPLVPALLECLAQVQDESNLAIQLTCLLSAAEREQLAHYSNAITKPFSEDAIEDRVRSILRDCWQAAGQDQRQQLVDFVGVRRAQKHKALQEGDVF